MLTAKLYEVKNYNNEHPCCYRVTLDKTKYRDDKIEKNKIKTPHIYGVQG